MDERLERAETSSRAVDTSQGQTEFKLRQKWGLRKEGTNLKNVSEEEETQLVVLLFDC